MRIILIVLQDLHSEQVRPRLRAMYDRRLTNDRNSVSAHTDC